MALKSLKDAAVDTLDYLVTSNCPDGKSRLLDYLSTLAFAREIPQGHDELKEAVLAAVEKYQVADDPIVRAVLRFIDSEQTREATK